MIAKKLKSMLPKSPLLIVLHDNPDPDALASAWSLGYLLKKIHRIKSDFAYGGLIGRAENRALVKELKIPMKTCRPALFPKYQTICMVDCQPYTGNSCLPDDVVPDVVIDHHPKRETTRYSQWAYIDKRLGATSTILAAAFSELEIRIPGNLATALFYAIRSETKDLGLEGSRLDYKYYLELLPQVDFPVLYRISHPPLTAHYYRSVKEAMERSRIYGSIVVCPLGEVPYPELPAEIADFLIFRERVDISFVMGLFREDIFLSMRATRPEFNAARMMSQLLDGLGRGGGHESMAGGKISDCPRTRLRDMEKFLINKLLKMLGSSHLTEKKLY